MITQILRFLKRCQDSPVSGLVRQRLCFAFQLETTDYYRLVAVLMAQTNDNPSGTGARECAPLTLRRLYVWMQDPIERLRIMLSLAEATETLHGGALASAVHAHMQHGDPMTGAFVERQMRALATPLLDMVKQWVTEGQLTDPHEEFFVAKHSNVPDECYWSSKYSLNAAMIPTFIEREQADKIFLIGKSINFIRRVCGDTEWDINAHSQSKAQAGCFEYGQWTKLRNFVNKRCEIVNKHVVSLMLEKFSLMRHFGALMRYLLLGQGEFFQCLMDLLVPELAKPATKIYRHNLVSALDQAIRASNAQYEPAEVLKRLDVHMHEPSPEDTGWDVFSLNYHVSSPVNVVISPTAAKRYLKIFNLLFKVKRMEYTLSSSWKRHLTANHTGKVCMQTVPGVPAMLHNCQILQNEMVHFVTNLQHYIMFEVLQTSWKRFAQRLPTEPNLDSIIRAHDLYLDEVVQKVLLDEKSSDIRKLLVRLFDVVIKFCNIQNRLYDVVLSEAERLARRKELRQKRLEKGKWGVEVSEDEDEASEFAAMLQRFNKPMTELTMASSEYSNLIVQLLRVLRNEYHWSESLQFLAFRLDFNKYYTKSNKEALGTPTPLHRRSVSMLHRRR